MIEKFVVFDTTDNALAVTSPCIPTVMLMRNLAPTGIFTGRELGEFRMKLSRWKV